MRLSQESSPLCKAKMQYLLTLWVSRYCLLALQSIIQYTFTNCHLFFARFTCLGKPVSIYRWWLLALVQHLRKCLARVILAPLAPVSFFLHALLNVITHGTFDHMLFASRQPFFLHDAHINDCDLVGTRDTAVQRQIKVNVSFSIIIKPTRIISKSRMVNNITFSINTSIKISYNTHIHR